MPPSLATWGRTQEKIARREVCVQQKRSVLKFLCSFLVKKCKCTRYVSVEKIRGGFTLRERQPLRRRHRGRHDITHYRFLARPGSGNTAQGFPLSAHAILYVGLVQSLGVAAFVRRIQGLRFNFRFRTTVVFKVVETWLRMISKAAYLLQDEQATIGVEVRRPWSLQTDLRRGCRTHTTARAVPCSHAISLVGDAKHVAEPTHGKKQYVRPSMIPGRKQASNSSQFLLHALTRFQKPRNTYEIGSVASIYHTHRSENHLSIHTDMLDRSSVVALAT